MSLCQRRISEQQCRHGELVLARVGRGALAPVALCAVVDPVGSKAFTLVLFCCVCVVRVPGQPRPTKQTTTTKHDIHHVYVVRCCVLLGGAGRVARATRPDPSIKRFRFK